MYRIGEFSYLCETTIKTLRHYDKINLLKPIMVDQYTGYRYYGDDQLEVFKKIKKLQDTGFKLNDIKDILFNKDISKLDGQKKIIEIDSINKLKILEELKYDLGGTIMKEKIEFIDNIPVSAVGVEVVIKNRDEISKYLTLVDKEIDLGSFENYSPIFINYEKGFKEEDILCFIGRIIPKEDNNLFDNILKDKDLVKVSNKMIKNYLHIEIENELKEEADNTKIYKDVTNEEILNAYKEMIKYANKSNIQIRGNFEEIYSKVRTDDEYKNKVDIYVEAYDLKIENKDTLRHYEQLEKSIKDINSLEFIGKWRLQGEVIEPDRLFNPKKEHYLPDTNLNTIILNEDGSTNFDNILWKDKYLIIKYKEITTYNLMLITKYESIDYLTILVNDNNTNSRPYIYYYKK